MSYAKQKKEAYYVEKGKAETPGEGNTTEEPNPTQKSFRMRPPKDDNHGDQDYFRNEPKSHYRGYNKYENDPRDNREHQNYYPKKNDYQQEGFHSTSNRYHEKRNPERRDQTEGGISYVAKDQNKGKEGNYRHEEYSKKEKPQTNIHENQKTEHGSIKSAKTSSQAETSRPLKQDNLLEQAEQQKAQTVQNVQTVQTSNTNKSIETDKSIASQTHHIENAVGNQVKDITSPLDSHALSSAGFLGNIEIRYAYGQPQLANNIPLLFQTPFIVYPQPNGSAIVQPIYPTVLILKPVFSEQKPLALEQYKFLSQFMPTEFEQKQPASVNK